MLSDAEGSRFWAERLGEYPAEVRKAAVKLHTGKVAEAYEELWESVRPHGRQDTFYADGKGE